MTIVEHSALWQDATQLPGSVSDTLERAAGHEELARAISRAEVRRIVVSGNGASWYAGIAIWLAALQARPRVEVIAVPAGVLACGGFRWREGDFLLAVSSSGALRDLLEAVDDPALPRPFGLITADADSPLGQADPVCALVAVRQQRAKTHTQAYLGAVVVGLDLVGRIGSDEVVRSELRRLPELLAHQLPLAPGWASEAIDPIDGRPPRSALVFGTGSAWVGALEAALLLREVAAVPSEGAETREAATTGMYALDADQLVVSLAVTDDPLAEEAGAICKARGARVLVCPWERQNSPAMAAALHFLYPLALALRLADRQGLDPDRPGWYAAYEATARRRPAATNHRVAVRDPSFPLSSVPRSKGAHQ